MTSCRQIEANRRNALKSTGPRTHAGKQGSRCDVVQHGLTAETVISALEDAEDYKAFEAAINRWGVHFYAGHGVCSPRLSTGRPMTLPPRGRMFGELQRGPKPCHGLFTSRTATASASPPCRTSFATVAIYETATHEPAEYSSAMSASSARRTRFIGAPMRWLKAER